MFNFADTILWDKPKAHVVVTDRHTSTTIEAHKSLDKSKHFSRFPYMQHEDYEFREASKQETQSMKY